MPPPLTVKFAVVPFAGMYKIIMKWDVSVSSQFDKNETIFGLMAFDIFIILIQVKNFISIANVASCLFNNTDDETNFQCCHIPR